MMSFLDMSIMLSPCLSGSIRDFTIIIVIVLYGGPYTYIYIQVAHVSCQCFTAELRAFGTKLEREVLETAAKQKSVRVPHSQAPPLKPSLLPSLTPRPPLTRSVLVNS